MSCGQNREGTKSENERHPLSRRRSSLKAKLPRQNGGPLVHVWLITLGQGDAPIVAHVLYGNRLCFSVAHLTAVCSFCPGDPRGPEAPRSARARTQALPSLQQYLELFAPCAVTDSIRFASGGTSGDLGLEVEASRLRIGFSLLPSMC